VVKHPDLACRAVKCALGLSLRKQSQLAELTANALPQSYGACDQITRDDTLAFSLISSIPSLLCIKK
jgi:hypothetical protein